MHVISWLVYDLRNLLIEATHSDQSTSGYAGAPLDFCWCNAVGRDLYVML